jgi:hypothetical protein
LDRGGIYFVQQWLLLPHPATTACGWCRKALNPLKVVDWILLGADGDL